MARNYPPDVLWNRDMQLLRLDAVLRKQDEKWGREHDLHHDSFEWLGLITQYAAAGRWMDAAALCLAAEAALNSGEGTA